MRLTLITFLLLILCQFISSSRAADQSVEEEAIRKSLQSYVEAFNRRDAKAVAAHWSDDGEWISPDGGRVKGAGAIEVEMEAYFAENQGRRIELINPSVRILAPTVAIEEGQARVTSMNEAPNDTTYIAIHVKRDGQWKLDSVRETEISPTWSNYEHLSRLEWMVGTWVDQDENGSIETTCQWTKNKNFLTRSFTVRIEDRIEMEGTQVVGWDAARGQIRSWVFDSGGGFTEGVWLEDGDRWIIKSTQVFPDGSRGSSINMITYIDNDTFRWASTGREIDGELQPNIDPVTVVRKSH